MCRLEFGVTKCLYREKHLAVVGSPCNGTVQVRYGWATALYSCNMYLQETEKSGVILKDIDKADATRIKFNLEKNLKIDCKYLYNINLKKNLLLMKVGKYHDKL